MTEGTGSSVAGQIAKAGVLFSGQPATGAASGYAGSVASQAIDPSQSGIDSDVADVNALIGAGVAVLPGLVASGAAFNPVTYSAGQEFAIALALAFYDVGAQNAANLLFADSLTPNPYLQPSTLAAEEFPSFPSQGENPSGRPYAKP